jgi:hypothetical protein
MRVTSWQVVTIDISGLEALASGLDNVYDVVRGGATNAVNRVVDSVREQTVDTIVSQVSLDRSYVDGKVEVSRYASESETSAMIEIQDDPVFLTRFGTTQATRSNVWTPAMYAAKFGSLETKRPPRPGAKPLPWTPRTGDASRGIAPGSKADGLKVRIGRNSGETHFRHVFTAGARSGNRQDGRIGTFSHVGPGESRIKGVYGPSPYQAAKGVWRDAEDAIRDQLGTEVLTEVETRIKKALSE